MSVSNQDKVDRLYNGIVDMTIEVCVITLQQHLSGEDPVQVEQLYGSIIEDKMSDADSYVNQLDTDLLNFKGSFPEFAHKILSTQRSGIEALLHDLIQEEHLEIKITPNLITDQVWNQTLARFKEMYYN